MDFGLGNGWVSQQLPCLCSPGTAVALLSHEAGNLHPEGTWGLLTEVIIPVSNGSQGTTAECTRRSLYVIIQSFKGIPPHSVSGLPLNQSCWRLLQGKTATPDFLTSHVLSEKVLSSVKRVENPAIWAAQCQAVSTGPNCVCRALIQPSWSLFLLVWAHPFT